MKFLNYIGLGLVIFMFGYLVYTNYLTLFPFQVAKVYYDENPLVNNVLHRGDAIAYKVDVEHLTEGVIVNVTRELHCGEDILSFAPISYTTHKKGREQFVNSTLTVPMRTPFGTCYVLTDGHFKISPLRTIDLVTRTEDFQVVE